MFINRELFRVLLTRNFKILKGVTAVTQYNKYFVNRYRFPVKSIFPNTGKSNQFLEKKLRQEYCAVIKLFERSGFNNAKHFPFYLSNRSFHTSKSNDQRETKDPKKPEKEDDDENKISSLIIKAFLWMLTAYMCIALVSLIFPSSNQPEVIRYVSWNEFVHHMLAKGEVEEVIVRPDVDIVTIVLHDGAIVKGKRIDHRTFHMNIVDINRFEEKMREAERRLGITTDNGIPVIYERSTDTAGKLLASLIVVAILLTVLSRKVKIQIKGIDSFTQLARAKFTLVDPVTGPGKGVHFSDVAGLSEAKIEVMEFVDYLKRPDHYRRLGAKVPKGALLLGPPGCGKTLLAKAVATEANVPFLSMNGSEFMEIIGGLGASRVRDLFKEARKRSPCIIYIDEIDAIGRNRRMEVGQYDGAASEGEHTLNQLLVEMDGMTSKEGVLMIASTNRAEVLDKALLRPGRFDRHILIDLPTAEERRQIFEQHLKGISLENKPDTYSKRLAYLTPGFSGADIANICNEAALHAARFKKKAVQGSDLEYAVERVVGGTEKRSSAVSPTEKRTVAYHESGHALVGWLLPHTDALLKVTIVPRTSLALGFAQYTPTEQRLFSKDELFERMCMALGGRAAEAITFNKITSGAQNDLQKVTRMAYAQVKVYGMNKNVGLVSFPEDSEEIGRRPYSKRLAALIDDEVHSLIAQAYSRTEKLLQENRDKLSMLAEELLRKETLSHDEVAALIGPPPHGKKHLIGPVEFELSLNQDAGAIDKPQQPKPSQGNKDSNELFASSNV